MVPITDNKTNAKVNQTPPAARNSPNRSNTSAPPDPSNSSSSTGSCVQRLTVNSLPGDGEISEILLSSMDGSLTEIDVNNYTSEIEKMLTEELRKMKESGASNASKHNSDWDIKVDKNSRNINIIHKDGVKLEISDKSLGNIFVGIDQQQVISLMQVLFKKTGGSNTPEICSILDNLDFASGKDQLFNNLFQFCNSCETRLNELLAIATVPEDKNCLEQISSSLKSTIEGLNLINTMRPDNHVINNKHKQLLMSHIYKCNRTLKGELEKCITQRPPAGKMLFSNIACDSGGSLQKRAMDSSAFHTGAGATAEALIGTFVMESFAGLLSARTYEQNGCSEGSIIMFQTTKIATVEYIRSNSHEPTNTTNIQESQQVSTQNIVDDGLLTQDELEAVEKFLDRNRSGIIPIRTKSRKQFNAITKEGATLVKENKNSYSLIEIEAQFKRHFNRLYKIPKENSVDELSKYINKILDPNIKQHQGEIKQALGNVIISAGGAQLDILSHLTRINEHIVKTNESGNKFCKGPKTPVKLIEEGKIIQLAALRDDVVPTPIDVSNPEGEVVTNCAEKSYTEWYKEITTLDRIPLSQNFNDDKTSIGITVKDNSIYWVLKITSDIKKSKLSKDEKFCLVNTLRDTLEQRSHGIFGPILKQSNYLFRQSICSMFRYNGFTLGSAVATVLTIVATLFFAPVVILGYLVATLAKMVSWAIFAGLGYYVNKLPTLGNTNTYQGISWILDNSIKGCEPEQNDNSAVTNSDSVIQRGALPITVSSAKKQLLGFMKASNKTEIQNLINKLKEPEHLASGLSYYVLSAYDSYDTTGEESSLLIDSLFKRYASVSGDTELKKDIFDTWNKAVLHYSIKNEIKTEFKELEVCPEKEKEEKIYHILRKYKANPNSYIINPNLPSATKTLLQFYKTVALIQQLPKYVLAQDSVTNPLSEEGTLIEGEIPSGVYFEEEVNNGDPGKINLGLATQITTAILNEFHENIKHVMGIGVDKKDSSSRWYDLRLRKESQINFIKFTLTMIGALVVWAIVSTIIMYFPLSIPAMAIGALKLATTPFVTSGCLFVLDGFRVVIGNGVSNSRLISHHSSSEAKQAVDFLNLVQNNFAHAEKLVQEIAPSGMVQDTDGVAEENLPAFLHSALTSRLDDSNSNGGNINSMLNNLPALIIFSPKIYNSLQSTIQTNSKQKIKPGDFSAQILSIINDYTAKEDKNFYLFLFDFLMNAYKLDSEVCDKIGAQLFYKNMLRQISHVKLDTKHKIICSYIFKSLCDNGEFNSVSFLQTHRGVLSRERFFIASFLLGGFTAATNISGIPGLEIPNFAGSCGLTGDVSNINSSVIGGICDTFGTLLLYYNCRKIKGNDTDSIDEFKKGFNVHIEALLDKLSYNELNGFSETFGTTWQDWPFFDELIAKISETISRKYPSETSSKFIPYIKRTGFVSFSS